MFIVQHIKLRVTLMTVGAAHVHLSLIAVASSTSDVAVEVIHYNPKMRAAPR